MQLENTKEDNKQETPIPKEEFARILNARDAEVCPYCNSKKFIKRGTRQNVGQVVQLYLCQNLDCGKTFRAQDVKGKHFSLHIIIEAMSYYNIGLSLVQTCEVIKQKFGVAPEPKTLSEWINEYKGLCRYERLRPYAVKMCKSKDTIEVVSMAHRQLYRFRYHRPKTSLMLTEFKNRNLRRIQEYLNAVSSETPHQYFQDGERMSDVRSKFSTADMIVKSKTNYANRLAAFVLQTVSENKDRHDRLQRFFIANDSCTVATEVPVYIRKEDIEYMENVLKFKVVGENGIEFRGKTERSLNGKATPALVGLPRQQLPKLLTGHIDLIQIRNGQIHIMDYKPNAAKERPIEQLTWYALALARLTGLRLFEFTCAWFDEKDYFEFYPLHVVKKLQIKTTKLRKRFINFKDGTKVEVPRENLGKVVIV